MKKWEDILKERLEGYESTLPEGSYAEFQKLRAAGKSAPRKKGYPLVWAAAAAVAATLAAVLFLRQPKLPEDGVQLVQQQPVEVQIPMADSLLIPEPEVAAPQLAQAAPPKRVTPSGRPAITQPGPIAAPQNEPEEIPQAEPEEAPASIEETIPEEPVPEVGKKDSLSVQAEPSVPTGSPFIPENRPRQKVNLKVAVPVTGGVLGTGALALLASNMLRVSQNEGDMATAYHELYSWANNHDYQGNNSGEEKPDPGTNGEEKLLDYKFAFPLRLGISARIPVWNSLYLNTGLEYSRYASELSFLLEGAKSQVAQYLGVPLRLDWVVPLGKWFDVYAGAGLQTDFCVGATWNGYDISRDKIHLSLGTAAGIQINPTPKVGLFIEPQLSWRVPISNEVLLTYRTRQPWMFSVSGGVRINLEKK